MTITRVRLELSHRASRNTIRVFGEKSLRWGPRTRALRCQMRVLRCQMRVLTVSDESPYGVR
eukprot:1183418-Prorocentrum_minimum.AAC.4